MRGGFVLFVQGRKALFLAMFVSLMFGEAGGVAALEQSGPYDPKADARAEIAQAVSRAQKESKHVLLVFGANWCPWCRALDQLFENNAEVEEYLNKNYELVLVDVGRGDKNLDLDSLYAHPIKLGLPALVVLDEKGALLHLQETGSLERKNSKEKGHDPERVLNFLRKWKHPVAEEQKK